MVRKPHLCQKHSIGRCIEHSVYGELRTALPYVNLIQVIHVLDENAIEEAKAIAPFVVFIARQSNPNLAVKIGQNGSYPQLGFK